MRINPVTTNYKNQVLKSHALKAREVEQPIEPAIDTVSFKGVKNATRLGATGGIAGAVVGWCMSFLTEGATAQLVAYMCCVGAAIGAVMGGNIDDDHRNMQLQ